MPFNHLWLCIKKRSQTYISLYSFQRLSYSVCRLRTSNILSRDVLTSTSDSCFSETILKDTVSFISTAEPNVKKKEKYCTYRFQFSTLLLKLPLSSNILHPEITHGSNVHSIFMYANEDGYFLKYL